jgi:hypothetical protein
LIRPDHGRDQYRDEVPACHRVRASRVRRRGGLLRTCSGRLRRAKLGRTRRGRRNLGAWFLDGLRVSERRRDVS